MALLGFHIVLTLIAASVLQKLSARFSFARWFLSSGLYRYLHPSTEELKSLSANNSTQKGIRRRKNYDNSSDARGFLLPKNADITLDRALVTSVDVVQLPYYADFRWLIDFSVFTTIVYCLTEAYRWLFPLQASGEVNLSIIWCILLIIFCLKSLSSLSAVYFRSSEDTGERSLCLSFGAVFFLLSMVFLVVAERIFDVNLTAAHENFTITAAQFLKSEGVEIMKNERSPIFFYLFLSMLCGFLGGMLVFPCFRYARMYIDALEYAKEDVLGRLLLHSSFFTPVVLIALWMKPLARDHLVESVDPVLTEDQLYSLRIWTAVAFVFLRFLTARKCLQAYLNIAHTKITELSREAGKINSLELQRMVARVFFYLCGASLQFFIPLILMLAICFILKTLGNYSWLTCFGLTDVPIPLIGTSKESEPREKSDIRTSLLSFYALFNVLINRSIWGFLLLAISVLIFSLNVVGVAYNSRFVK